MHPSAKKCFIAAALAILAGFLVSVFGYSVADAWARTAPLAWQARYGSAPAIYLWQLLSGTLMPLGVVLIGAGVVIQSLQGPGRGEEPQ